jgi:hypothetical protein
MSSNRFVTSSRYPNPSEIAEGEVQDWLDPSTGQVRQWTKSGGAISAVAPAGSTVPDGSAAATLRSRYAVALAKPTVHMEADTEGLAALPVLGVAPAPGVTTVTPGVAGVAELQFLYVDGGAGTFTLTWGAATTGALAFDISAADLQTALVALASIAPGDVVVSGGPGGPNGAAPYVLAWAAALGAAAHPTADVTSLTGGGHAVTCVTVTPGADPTAEVHQLSVAASGGTFTVTFGDQTTGSLAYNVIHADLQTALVGLSNVAPGDVVVSGGPGDATGSTPYLLTWAAALGNVAPPSVTSSLTVTVTQAQANARANALAAALHAHMVGVGTAFADGEHKAADTALAATLAAVPAATTLGTCITLVNAIQTASTSHGDSAGVHFADDDAEAAGTIPTDPPTTLAHCVADLNALRQTLLTHFSLGSL